MKIYLDNNASTIPDKNVLETFLYYTKKYFANPSSAHFQGHNTRTELEKIRDKIAEYFQVRANEVIFTSGGTEGCNTAVNIIEKNNNILTSSLEHSAIRKPFENKRVKLVKLPVENFLDFSSKYFNKQTKYYVITSACPVTGVLLNLRRIKKLKNSIYISDAVSLIGKVEYKKLIEYVDFFDVLIFSGHKFHCLKNTGFMIIKSHIEYKPLILGGSQEYGKRAGTESIANAACLLAGLKNIKDNNIRKINSLREYLEIELKNKIKDCLIVGEKRQRICNTSYAAIKNIKQDELINFLSLNNICVSSDTACASVVSGTPEILEKLNLKNYAGIRISLSKYNTKKEIDYFIKKLKIAVERLAIK